MSTLPWRGSTRESVLEEVPTREVLKDKSQIASGGDGIQGPHEGRNFPKISGDIPLSAPAARQEARHTRSSSRGLQEALRGKGQVIRFQGERPRSWYLVSSWV